MSTETPQSRHPADLYVAGVGVSAGGLDALGKLLSGFKLNGQKWDIAVVVVMHLSPTYKSELTAILGKRCPWPVVTATDGAELQSKHIYVTPQNSQILIKSSRICLEPLPENYENAPSIDRFFSSLAGNFGQHAIGVILSGFGHDGTKGLTEIQEKGGFTLAQLPDTAEYKDMPQSAINANVINKVTPAEHMFQEIHQFVFTSETIKESPNRDKSIDAIFELLEKRSGTNFACYKPSTIMRRINVRMQSLQIQSLAEYYELLKNQPVELDKLFATVLIGVTEFFRDPEAFEELPEHLEELIREKNHGSAIRIWSVGCATGEEAHTIAILLHEMLGRDVANFHIQVFASDIDESALNACRKGIYPLESVVHIPGAILKKYFNKRGDSHYEVKKVIKQHILFTRHDVTKDPPFVKLDMVVCRNLLIYFNNQLQKQTLQIFHYALRSRGLLFLGKSESVGVTGSLFSKVNSHKLFKKSEQSSNYQLRFSQYLRRSGRDEEGNQRDNQSISLVEAAKESLYHQYESPFVVIDEEAEIREVHGSLRLYLEISEGAMNTNIFRMVNKELVSSLQALTAQVKRTGVGHTSQILKFSLYDNDHWVRIKVNPLIYPVNNMEYQMVVFEKVEETDHLVLMQQKLETADLVDYRIRELEDELATTKEHLQIFTEELESTNEELQTMNEELQSSNEELKSSNEELETSNEELQSANEELNTANYELRLTNEALLEKEEELRKEKEISERNKRIYKAIVENMPGGTVGILNENLEVEFIGGQGLNRFGIKPEDVIGKVLPDMNPSEKEQQKLRGVFNQALEGKAGHTKFDYEDFSYEIQTAPIRYNEHDPPKVMYLTQDITEEKRQDLKLRMALKASEVTVVEYDYVKDRFNKNNRLNSLLGYPPNKVISMQMFLDRFLPIDRKQRDRLSKKAAQTGNITYEARLLVKDELKWIRVLGRILNNSDGDPQVQVLSIQDITRDKLQLQAVRDREEYFRLIADSAPVMIWIRDTDHSLTYLNSEWIDFTGRDLENQLGVKWLKGVHPEDRDILKKVLDKARKAKKPFTTEYRLLRHDGMYRDILERGVPILGKDNQIEAFIGSCIDITQQKEFASELEREVAQRTRELEASNRELKNLNMSLEQYAYAASHDLQEPLRKIETYISMVEQNPGDTEAVEKYLDRISASSERMRILVRDILNYNSINEKGERSEVDLDELLDGIKKDLGLMIKEKGATLKSSELGKIEGVKPQLYQLFVNLIKNSLTYTRKEPEISITREVKSGRVLASSSLKTDPEKEYHCYSFTDNGIGLDPKQFDRLILPFKRGHSRDKYPGSGLGLAICDRIVAVHDGVWSVEGKPGEGSTFTVCLPV